MPNSIRKPNPNKRGVFELAERAQTDIREIWDYIGESNAASADKLLVALFAKFQLLADNAELGRSRNELMLNLRSFPFKKLIIFYVPSAAGVEIFRIIHGSRNIESIFDEFFDDLKPPEQQE